MIKNLFKQLPLVIIIVFLLFASFYLGLLYNQKQVFLSQQANIPSPLPKANPNPQYIGWLAPKESKNWQTLPLQSTKTTKYSYSYKYPQNLYMVFNVRGHSPQTPYFFADQKSYQQYAECVNNGSLPAAGQDLARDWEGGCDQQNLLFTINIHIGGQKSTENMEVGNLQDYQTTKDLIWTIPTKDAYFGGMGDTTYVDTNTVYNGQVINLELYFPNTESKTKTQMLTGLDTQTLLQQILVSFQINIVEN